MRRTPELRISFLMLFIIGTASYNFTVVFPHFVERGLHGGNTDYTLLYSVFSAGAVIGTLLVARRPTVDTRTLIRGAAGFGVALTGLAFVPNVAVAFPIVALVGGTRPDGCAADRPVVLSLEFRRQPRATCPRWRCEAARPARRRR